MDERLNHYLEQAYRRDVLRESVEVVMPDVDPKEVDQRIAKIDALRLGPHLANRAFVSYQNRRALIALRDHLSSYVPAPREGEDAAP